MVTGSALCAMDVNRRQPPGGEFEGGWTIIKKIPSFWGTLGGPILITPAIDIVILSRRSGSICIVPKGAPKGAPRRPPLSEDLVYSK